MAKRWWWWWWPSCPVMEARARGGRQGSLSRDRSSFYWSLVEQWHSSILYLSLSLPLSLSLLPPSNNPQFTPYLLFRVFLHSAFLSVVQLWIKGKRSVYLRVWKQKTSSVDWLHDGMTGYVKPCTHNRTGQTLRVQNTIKPTFALEHMPRIRYMFLPHDKNHGTWRDLQARPKQPSFYTKSQWQKLRGLTGMASAGETEGNAQTAKGELTMALLYP